MNRSGESRSPCLDSPLIRAQVNQSRWKWGKHAAKTQQRALGNYNERKTTTLETHANGGKGMRDGK